jgi:endonuclease/exonuclease/phosphatase family metal-dependent hydrolase
MQSWKSMALALMLAALLTTTVQTPASAGGPSMSQAPGRLGVMTLNMYIGADLDPLRAVENPEDLPGVVAKVWEHFLDTNVTERVKAMAGLIRILRPDLIGLQEATLIRTQDPGDFFSATPKPAEHVAYDFVALLLNALEQSRLSYRAVAQSQNFDIEVPRANANGLPETDVRITDRDVILARGDVEVDPRVTGRNYTAHLQFGFVPVLRGFVAVDATVGGTTYRFATTHLESGTFPPPPEENIRVEQVNELIVALDELDKKKSLPLIVVGDFNAEAPGGDAYVPMLNAEYEDTWTERVGAPAEGFTCCQDSTLLNPDSDLHERIDLIFARDIGLQRVVARTGLDKPGQKTASGLWPSDHAAVFASLVGQGRPLAGTGVPDAPRLAAGR